MKISYLNSLIFVSIAISGNAMWAKGKDDDVYHGTRVIAPKKFYLPLADAYNAIPNSYPLLTLNYTENDLPGACDSYVFSSPCERGDGECRTQKGMCGETLSTSFFLKSRSWKDLQGHINGNQGFDGFYKVKSNPDLKYVIVEDKSGEFARLNPRTRQGSLFWQHNRAEKVSRAYGEIDHSEFEKALFSGEVVSLFTHTFFKDNRMRPKGKSLSVRSGASQGYDKPVDIYSITSDRYSLATDISLLGSPEWSALLQGNYLNGYQRGIHAPILMRNLEKDGCPGGNNTYCIGQNERQERNFRLLTQFKPNELRF